MRVQERTWELHRGRSWERIVEKLPEKKRLTRRQESERC